MRFNVSLLSNPQTDLTNALFRFCNLRFDDSNCVTDDTTTRNEKENPITNLQQHQEYVLHNVTKILSNYPDLIHSTTNDISKRQEIDKSCAGYNLLLCVCTNPSLMNYIPLIQYLLQTSEYVVEEQDSSIDNNSSSQNNRFGTRNSLSFSVTPKLKQRASLTSSSPTSIVSWNSSIAMNDIVPTQARIIRERTNDTNGFNCLHLLLQNSLYYSCDPEQLSTLTLQRNTLKYFMKSYPASVCCKDSKNIHTPLHYACLNAYRYYTSTITTTQRSPLITLKLNTTSDTDTDTDNESTIGDIVISEITDNNTDSDVISPIEIIMLLAQQYPEACAIPNRDGNLPLHLAVAGTYLGTITATVATDNTQALCKAEQPKPKTLPSSSGYSNDSMNRSATIRQFFRHSFGGFNRSNTISHDPVQPKEGKDQVETKSALEDSPDLDETNNSDEEETTISFTTGATDDEDNVDDNDALTASIMNLSSSSSDMNPFNSSFIGSPTRTTDPTTMTTTTTTTTTTTMTTNIDSLLDVIQYLIETYPEALDTCNHNGYTPAQLALAYYQDPETTSTMKKDLKIVNILRKLSRRREKHTYSIYPITNSSSDGTSTSTTTTGRHYFRDGYQQQDGRLIL